MSLAHTPYRAVAELLAGPLRVLATTYRQAAIALLDDDGDIHAGLSPPRLDLYLRRIGEVEDVEDAPRRLMNALDAIADLNRQIDASPPTMTSRRHPPAIALPARPTSTSPSETVVHRCDRAATAA
jgi:hypothetical protein